VLDCHEGNTIPFSPLKVGTNLAKASPNHANHVLHLLHLNPAPKGDWSSLFPAGESSTGDFTVQTAFRSTVLLAVITAATASAGQTFDVNGQSASPPPSKQSKKQTAPHPNNETGMGWGSSIEVAREARAAQTALDHGDPRSAADHAQRAVNAAPQNYELWFTLAYAARLSGQYSLSVDAYRRGLALKPSSIQGLSGLAQTYARMGRSKDAEDTLKQVLAANPRSDQDLQLAGELLLPTDPREALSYLQRAEGAKSSPRTELLLARAYDRTGDGESAGKMLERARKSAPKNPEVLRAVASYYRDEGHYDEAIRTLEAVPTKDANTLAELGYTYTLAGRTREAATAYAEAARRSPGDIAIQLNAAQAMLNAGDFGKSTALLDHAATLNPDYYRLHALRGRLASAEHKNEDAIHEYETALQHLPAEIPEGVLYPISLRVDLTDVYRDNGDNANAERVAKDAAAAISNLDISGAERPEFLRLRAAVELSEGNSDLAEKDLQQAMQIEPRNVILQLNYANLLRKIGRKEDARKTYQQALAIDSSNAAALGALGFLSREMGDDNAARGYFLELAKKHPDDYVPYLALGDLNSDDRHFKDAEDSYEQAFKLSPEHPLIVSGAMNAALEAHQTALAKQWFARASSAVQQNPQVMREQERYLTITGNYAESANLGYQVIRQLTNDREGVDYLAYDLLFLNRLDEASKIVSQYESALPKDYDLPLIAGYVDARHGDNQDAVREFSRALEIEPKMAVGYMNRGYVYNDMRLATRAEQDFRKALQLNPKYGEAHLGLAYALVQLRRASQALKEADAAAALLPDSESLHLVKAEAFRQRAMLVSAESEYKKALKFNPNSTTTYIALADAQYRAHKYSDTAETLKSGLAGMPNDPMLLAQLGRADARLGQSADALQAITSAQKTGGRDYKVLLVTAEALRLLHHRDEAMSVYARALEGSDEDRLQIRLALARTFAEEGKAADTQQQVALGFAEARVASTDVTTADDYLNAADIMLSIHEYVLAQRLYGRAQALGADETSVAVGMANASLALGDTRSAEAQLASLHDDPERMNSADFLIAQGNVYRQLGKDDLALADFVHASQLDPDDPGTRTTEMELAEEEGHPLTDHLGIGTDVRVNPVFEDENIYQLDAQLFGVRNTPALLPPPRRTVETFAESRFEFHPDSFPVIQGFVAERNAQGSLSFPSELLIEDRNTFDTIFNFSVTPRVQIGDVKLAINPGLQFTIRRDALSPGPMDQNLFRQFLYVASSPIMNWLSFSGNVIREAGPFTEMSLHSRDFSGQLDFRVGRPWGKTTLLTGYNARDLLYTPTPSTNYRAETEFYETISYAGLERQFGSRIRASAAAEFLRAWKIENLEYATAQTLRPRFAIDAKIRDRWELSANGAWSSGRTFHAYDSVTTNFVVTYTRDRGWSKSGGPEASAAYPMRFSFGLGQQTFYNFSGHQSTQIVPVAQFSF
jgi:tetratricopeptide (TPR) repeat protein